MIKFNIIFDGVQIAFLCLYLHEVFNLRKKGLEGNWPGKGDSHFADSLS